MLLFSRMATATAPPHRSMPRAMAVTEIVNRKTDLDVSLWSASFGQPMGTIAWAARAETQTQLASATAALIEDAEYQDAVDALSEMLDGAQDTLSQLVHGAPTPSQVGSVAQLTTAVADVTRGAEAVAWAVDMAQYVEGVLDMPVAVTTDVFGALGTLSFMAVVNDLETSEANRAKLAGDQGYLERIAKSDGLFIVGSGNVTQAMRVM